MRVKMLKLMCSPVHGNHHPGAVVDLPARVAEKRIAAGDCVPVDERPAVPPRPVDEPPPVDKPVDKMTVDELRAYADGHGVDLDGATRKRDILAAIEAAQDED